MVWAKPSVLALWNMMCSISLALLSRHKVKPIAGSKLEGEVTVTASKTEPSFGATGHFASKFCLAFCVSVQMLANFVWLVCVTRQLPVNPVCLVNASGQLLANLVCFVCVSGQLLANSVGLVCRFVGLYILFAFLCPYTKNHAPPWIIKRMFCMPHQ